MKPKTIALELTEHEAGVLMAVLDAGVKAAGVQAVRALAPVLGKIDAAIEAAQAAQTGVPDFEAG